MFRPGPPSLAVTFFGFLGLVGFVGLLVLALAAVTAGAATTAVPRGKRTPRKPATHVVVRRATLDAQGVEVHLASGLAVIVPGARIDAPIAGRVTATLAGQAELGGRIEGSALGARLAHATALGDPSGGPSLGEGREGAFVTALGKAPGNAKAPGSVVCDTVGPVRARVLVPAEALTAEARELVYPVVSEPGQKMVAVVAETELLAGAGGRVRAHLARGARVLVLGEDGGGRGGWARVRTYGAFALDGVVARDRLGPTGETGDSAQSVEAGGAASPASKGLTPTHEVLVEAAASADAAGRKPIGTLRGGTLVTVGIEVAGPRVKVMTYGDVVGEMWVPAAALRSLERDVWTQGN